MKGYLGRVAEMEKGEEKSEDHLHLLSSISLSLLENTPEFVIIRNKTLNSQESAKKSIENSYLHVQYFLFDLF